MLHNLKQAKIFAQATSIKMPIHIDLAFHPAEHNSCFTKYKKFILDNFEPMAQYDHDNDFIGKLTEIYGNDILI